MNYYKKNLLRLVKIFSTILNKALFKLNSIRWIFPLLSLIYKIVLALTIMGSAQYTVLFFISILKDIWKITATLDVVNREPSKVMVDFMKEKALKEEYTKVKAEVKDIPINDIPINDVVNELNKITLYESLSNFLTSLNLWAYYLFGMSILYDALYPMFGELLTGDQNVSIGLVLITMLLLRFATDSWFADGEALFMFKTFTKEKLKELLNESNSLSNIEFQDKIIAIIKHNPGLLDSEVVKTLEVMLNELQVLDNNEIQKKIIDNQDKIIAIIKHNPGLLDSEAVKTLEKISKE